MQMSEYPYEDKIHSKDRVNYKTVKSSDGKRIGKVEARVCRIIHCQIREAKQGDKIRNSKAGNRKYNKKNNYS